MADYDDLPYLVIEKRSSGGVGAFLVGALLGAGVALLMAPRSGEQTREEIRTGVNRLRERAEETVRHLSDSVNDTIGNVREEVDDRLTAARDAFEAGRRAARESRDDMERRVTEAKTRVRAGIDAARQPVAEPLPTEGNDVHNESDLGV